ncbi:AAA family ATPase [Streptomyces sp. NBC_01718]|uniref:AAA family ATPase n=1 Tax=Streptomyces sp. NBC_01718 TaxID=2975919 RepID=UPI00352C736E
MVGRSDLRESARSRLAAGGSVLLSGPAGIGKTTAIAAIAAEAAAEARVLRSAPTPADATVPFLTLIDLLAPIADETAASLPAPQARTIDVLLHRTSEGAVDRLAVRLSVLGAFSAAARQAPLLLVLDDLQCVDPESADVLGFLVRRVEGRALLVLAGERVPEHGEPKHQALCVPPVLELRMGPMSAADIAQVVKLRTATDLPAAAHRAIHAVSGGNPLFAVELARALARRGKPFTAGRSIPVPRRLRTLMAQRLDRLGGTARETLLVASALARPTPWLLTRAGRGETEQDLDQAALLQVADTDEDGVVRFAHPLLAATLYDSASGVRRRAVHAQLAEVVPDPVERARHLALAGSQAAEPVARSLIDAAMVSRERGAAAVAAQLASLAADRTPQETAELAAERRLFAAECAMMAGLYEDARRTAERVLEAAELPANRVGARLLLIDSAGQAIARGDSGRLFDDALADAGADPVLQASVRVRLALRQLAGGSLVAAESEASCAAALAAQGGPEPQVAVRTERLALEVLAAVQTWRGDPTAADTAERAVALSLGSEDLGNSPHLVRARLRFLADRPAEARAELEQLMTDAERQGRTDHVWSSLVSLVEVEARAGNCGRALRLARRTLQLAGDAELSRGPALYVSALAEASGGSAVRAAELAAEGVAAAEADGDRLYLLRNLAVQGQAALVLATPGAALGPLRRAAELYRDLQLGEPGISLWHADLAEALITAGEYEESVELLDLVSAQARRLRRYGVLACLDRAAALQTAAMGNPAKAADSLRAVAEQLRALPLPLELGRTLLAIGQVERRCRRRARAREALVQAGQVFAAAGAAPWQARTRAELDRIGVRTGSPDAGLLTEDETRVARMAASGATNAEIAAALFVSTKTVEAKLSRVYTKLGIRSRVALTANLPEN